MQIKPGSALVDVPYDGVDHDCDDANDFDADGDGFMPPGMEADYEVYVARYWPGEAPPFPVPAERAFEDCLDVVHPSIVNLSDGVVADPAHVHPDTIGFPAQEQPYDGIDSDCEGDNDFDADGDAFMPADVEVAWQAYIDAYGFTPSEVAAWASVNPDAGLIEPATGDCDDLAPARWPGALEVLGDGVDQDCDGAPDSAPFGFSDFLWTSPTNPEVGRVDDQFLVLVGAAEAQLRSAGVQIGVGLPFELSEARGAAEISATVLPAWKGNPVTELQGVIDAAPDPLPVDLDSDGIPDPTLYVATTYANAFQTWVYLSGVGRRSASDVLLPPAQALANVSRPAWCRRRSIARELPWRTGASDAAARAQLRVPALWSLPELPGHVWPDSALVPQTQSRFDAGRSACPR